MVVDAVLKFSNVLQNLVSLSELVSFCELPSLIIQWAPYASLALGSIRYFFKVMSMWYDN